MSNFLFIGKNRRLFHSNDNIKLVHINDEHMNHRISSIVQNKLYILIFYTLLLTGIELQCLQNCLPNIFLKYFCRILNSVCTCEYCPTVFARTPP
jgi:hypothetical protein